MLVGIAAWNRYLLVPEVAGPGGAGAAGGTTATTARRRLGRTVAVEAALLVLVLAATGVLVSRSPVVPTTPSAQDAATSGVEVVEELGDGTLRARVMPGRVGVNALEVELLDAAGAPFEPVAVPELATTLADPALGPFSRPLTHRPGRVRGDARPADARLLDARGQRADVRTRTRSSASPWR